MFSRSAFGLLAPRTMLAWRQAEQTVCVDSRGVCVFSLASCCWCWHFLRSERSSSLKGELSPELRLFHFVMFNLFFALKLPPSFRGGEGLYSCKQHLWETLSLDGLLQLQLKTYVHLWLQLLHQTRRHQAAEMVQKDSTHCTAGGIYGVFTGEDEVKHAEMFQEIKR